MAGEIAPTGGAKIGMLGLLYNPAEMQKFVYLCAVKLVGHEKVVYPVCLGPASAGIRAGPDKLA